MSSPKVSIVMTTYNRARLLDNTLMSIANQGFSDYEVIIVDDGNDTDTPQLILNWRTNRVAWCDEKLKYFRLGRDRTQGYNNPARPNNVGIRQAKGDIIILQNAEVKHGPGEIIMSLAGNCGSSNVAFAQVETLNEYGTGKDWYCHRVYSPRPFFFCGALRREWFEKLRGFDEDYQYYGFDDNDFADRLTAAGVQFDFTDIPVQHQWHPTSYNPNDPNNAIPALTYQRKTNEMRLGKIGIERNLGREWGAL